MTARPESLHRRPVAFEGLAACAGHAPARIGCPCRTTALSARHLLLHDLKYPADFEHFDYANPSAPKGGTLNLSTTWTIRNFSGAWGTGVSNAAGLERTMDRLFTRSADEPASIYGWLADGVALSEDGKSLFIRLHKKARWRDGVPITTKDIRFSYDVMGATSLAGKTYLKSWVDAFEIINDRELVIRHKDVFTQSNLLALTSFPVRPAHYYADRDPGETTLEPPLVSGPYRIAAFDRNHVVYERVEDYWGRNLPINRGATTSRPSATRSTETPPWRGKPSARTVRPLPGKRHSVLGRCIRHTGHGRRPDTQGYPQHQEVHRPGAGAGLQSSPRNAA